MKMKVEVNPKQLLECNADSRGRINIGSDHANTTVRVLILDE